MNLTISTSIIIPRYSEKYTEVYRFRYTSVYLYHRDTVYQRIYQIYTIAWNAVFSHFKKSSGCLSCYNFLTTNKPLEVNNDVGSQYP